MTTGSGLRKAYAESCTKCEVYGSFVVVVVVVLFCLFFPRRKSTEDILGTSSQFGRSTMRAKVLKERRHSCGINALFPVSIEWFDVFGAYGSFNRKII